MNKNLIYFIIFLFVLFLLPSPSLAVVGQLINAMGAPEQTDVSPYIEALNACKAESEKNNTLYKECTQQQSQQNKAYNILLNNLVEEKKKNLFTLIGAVSVMIVSLISSIVVVIIFRKKLSALPSSPLTV